MVSFAALQLISGSLISNLGNSRAVPRGGRCGKGTGQVRIQALLLFPLTGEIPWSSLEAHHQEFRGADSVHNAVVIFISSF